MSTKSVPYSPREGSPTTPWGSRLVQDWRRAVLAAVLPLAACGGSPTGPSGLDAPLPVSLATPAPITVTPAVIPSPEPRPVAASCPPVERWRVARVSTTPDWITVEGVPLVAGGHAVVPACLDAVVGPGGPEWNVNEWSESHLGPLGAEGHADPSDPYRFMVRPGMVGTILPCTHVDGPGTGLCGKLFIG